MALKGYLASGFQKLIGASRLKGANDQWVGEYNQQSSQTVLNRFTETLVPGFNLITFDGTTFAYTSGALFSVLPTTATMVTIRNQSSSEMSFTSVGGSGGAFFATPVLILGYRESVTLVYNTSDSTWYEIARSALRIAYSTYTQTVSASNLNLQNVRDYDVIFLNSSFSGTITYTTINNQYAVKGRTMTIIGDPAISASSPIIFQRSTTTGGNKMILNGDYELVPGGTLRLVYDGTTWFEVSRSTPTL
jgi:hypothetical protein